MSNTVQVLYQYASPCQSHSGTNTSYDWPGPYSGASLGYIDNGAKENAGRQNKAQKNY